MAEGSFLEVYQKLYEAPDPAQALQAALVRGHLPPCSQHDVACCLYAKLHSRGCHRQKSPCRHTFVKAGRQGRALPWDAASMNSSGVVTSP